MSEPNIPLKNQHFAAVLAFLFPGAGHLYQGRTFKGILYMVCILGTFVYGMHLGEWRVVYAQWEPGRKNFGYLSQVLVGAPALPALVQAQRYPGSEDDDRAERIEPFSESFRGVLSRTTGAGHRVERPVDGRVHLEPVQGGIRTEIRGVFKGTLHADNGEVRDVELELAEVSLGPELYAEPRRELNAEVVGGEADAGESRRLEGTIPRSFWNWFEVPIEPQTLQALHGRLGKFYELALVYTWIAGLLNILAIWDALEGPAYGYGLEESTAEEKRRPAGGSRSSDGRSHSKQAASSREESANRGSSGQSSHSTAIQQDS